MIVHEIQTPLSPAEVIERALALFPLAGTPYAAFPERVGPTSLKLHLEVGEIVIGALRRGEVTIVRGSASRGGHLLTRFLTLLGEPADARSETRRHGLSETRGTPGVTFERGEAGPGGVARAA